METLDISARSGRRHGHARAMLRAGTQAIAWWVAALTLATLNGYPGAALLTPAAWVLAAGAGHRYALLCLGEGRRPRLGRSALLGALFGLTLGLICAAVVLGRIPIEPADRGRTYALLAGLAAAGAIVCAPLSVIGTWLVRRRLPPMTPAQGAHHHA